ncbi:aminopeptidase [Furfurilactobacillus sp. WILCCON 0119]
MTLTNFEPQLDQYADLIIKTGANVQPGQTIIIYISVDQAPLARRLTERAYAQGAAEVVIEWNDQFVQRAFLQHASTERLQQRPDYLLEKNTSLMAQHATRISVISEDPNGLAAVPSDRLALANQGTARISAPIRTATMNNDISWVVVAAASVPWATQVFPDKSATAALDALWTEIFKTTRVDQPDPVLAWHHHVDLLNAKAAWLNEHQFTALEYRSPLTHLTVGLPEHHVWEAAGATDATGNFFVPNMPTEEVFTAPDNQRIDGTVVSTKPLSYAGTLLTDIHVTFSHGRIVAATAATGNDVLQQLINTDAGARSLGEVSLVPDSSPISQSGIIFYNTLFDENASDHLAIGAAYPFNVAGGTSMNTDQLAAAHLNQSDVHVDFMVGSADLDIDGVTADGTAIPVFRQGNWA